MNSYGYSTITKAGLERKLNENLNPMAIGQTAKDSRFVLRSRKMDPSAFLEACLLSLSNCKEWTLSSVYRCYSALQSDRGKECLSWEPFHDFLCKPAFLKFVKSVSEPIAELTSHFATERTKPLIEILEQKLGVDDVYVQDGCEITLHSNALRFECPGKTGGSALKLHAVLSLKCLTEICGAITGSLVSERGQIPYDMLENKLILCDAGYSSYEVFNKITKAGGKFIMKMHSNCALPVMYETAVTKDGEAGPCESPKDGRGKPVGVCHKHNRDRQNRDIIGLHDKCDFPLRVVRLYNEAEDKYVHFATNISPDELDLYQIAELYRCRWQVERRFRVLQGFNSMKGSRTSYRHIQEAFIHLSVMLADLKMLCSYMLESVTGKEISNEKLSNSGTNMLDQIFSKALQGKRTTAAIGHLVKNVKNLVKCPTGYINRKRGKSIPCVIEVLRRERYETPLIDKWRQMTLA